MFDSLKETAHKINSFCNQTTLNILNFLILRMAHKIQMFKESDYTACAVRF